MKSSKKMRLAIVGFGPRGLGALEALATRLIKLDQAIEIDIYDEFGWAGAGPNYHPKQSELCLLNIPARMVDYLPPEFMATRIKPYLDWSAGRYQANEFPPRCDIGAYLHERFQALDQAVSKTLGITFSLEKITSLEQATEGWLVSSQTDKHGPYDEVLLSQGQPQTSSDAQLDRWIEHAAEHNLKLLPVYPANAFIADARNWQDKTVAIRGLGLSTLDALRMLTKGRGGKFNGGRYEASGKEPRKILPFSLDGRPPTAKPATEALDKLYDPADKERELFKSALETIVANQPQAALRTICDALIAPTVRILSKLNSSENEDDVRIWLDIERKDPGAQDVSGAVEGLRSDIEIAHGRLPPSVGYVVGQLWRKFQGEFRCWFNENQQEVDTLKAIVGFDEAFKRFSYGPPVAAAEELLALLEDGIVSLCTVDDPAILLNDNGWQLIEGENVVTATVMVDAVLPSPSLRSTRDPLLLDCMAAGVMKPIADGFGAHIFSNGQLVGQTDSEERGLCMLGRLTLGSVIAVDGLDDCFGPSAKKWANGVVDRMSLRASQDASLNVAN